MISKPIPVTLIGGYLGSGKTTLINHLLNQEHDHRIAVLVNDFGELAIDAALIEAEKDNIVSLSGGCVCCSYGNDLSNALMDVMAMDNTPDQIVIEASGVAMPGAIASSVSLMPQLIVHSIIILANAELIREQATDRYVGDTIERQLSSADLLVLNKIDLINHKQLHDLKQWRTVNWPATHTVYVEQSQLPVSIILDTIASADQLAKQTPSAIRSSSNSEATSSETASIHASSLTHASLFTTFRIDIPAHINAKALVKVLAREDAQLLRAKGFVQDEDGAVKLLQLVGKRWNVTDAPADSISNTGTGVVCIGLAHLAKASDIIALIAKHMNVAEVR